MQMLKRLNAGDETWPFERSSANIRRGDCYFYHTTELSDGSVVEGDWDLRGRFADYIGDTDLRGARVLDVGTASGYLSFAAEKAGAREVVSFDLDTAKRQHLLPFRDSLYVTDHEEWARVQTEAFQGWKNAYWYTHRDQNSRARVVYGDVYDLTDGIGTFDVVILGSILEHLGDPMRAIGSVARVATDRIVINTDVMEGDQALARFNGHPDHPERSYVFWTCTVETYRRMLAICGFEIERTVPNHFRARSRLSPDQGWVSAARTAIVARRMA